MMNDISSSLLTISDFADRGIVRIGNTLAWLNGVLLVLIITQVILRYFFSKGLVTLDEMEWYLYSVNVMFGLAYAVAKDTHIRLDVMSSRFRSRTRNKIELFGSLFLVFPWAIIIMIHGWAFFHNSWVINECSAAPMGLPYRWLIKMFIPLGFGLLGVAILSRMVRSFALLIKKEQ